MRYFSALTLLSLAAVQSVLARPTDTADGSEPTPVAYKLALSSIDEITDMVYIGIGLGVTLELNGKNTTCGKIDDYDNCMYTLPANLTDANQFGLLWYDDGKPMWNQVSLPSGIFKAMLMRECGFSGRPSNGTAEFTTEASQCWIRSMADGTAESYGVTVVCAKQSEGGPCKQPVTSSAPWTSEVLHPTSKA